MRMSRHLLVVATLCVAMVLASFLHTDVLAVENWDAVPPAVNCNPSHHTPAPFLNQVIGNDEARIYANLAQTIIVAMRIAECGNRWFFVLYYDGKFHTNFFPADGWGYISRQINNYGLSLITWRNVVVESVASMTVLSLGFFFPTFIFIPWISPSKLFGIPEPTVTAAEAGDPVFPEEQLSPLETPTP